MRPTRMENRRPPTYHPLTTTHLHRRQTHERTIHRRRSGTPPLIKRRSRRRRQRPHGRPARMAQHNKSIGARTSSITHGIRRRQCSPRARDPPPVGLHPGAPPTSSRGHEGPATPLAYSRTRRSGPRTQATTVHPEGIGRTPACPGVAGKPSRRQISRRTSSPQPIRHFGQLRRR